MAVAWLRLRLLLRPSLYLSIFLILSPVTDSATESEALLKLKKSLTNIDVHALDSWSPGSMPCGGKTYWIGLLCYNGVVVGIRLGEMGLSGSIDVDALVELHGLRSISLMKNNFSGKIPEFNRLSYLKAIYLSGNKFSGEIPSDYFVKMDSLKKIFLSDNKFTGKIPSSLAKIPDLVELNLQDNQFSGSIPSFPSPSLMSFNVSNNKLEGRIPASLSKFDARSFRGNDGLCGEKLGKDCSKKAAKKKQKQKKKSKKKNDGSKTMIIIIMVLVALVLIIIILLIIRSLIRRRDNFNVLKENAAEDHHHQGAVEVHVSDHRSLPANTKQMESFQKGRISTSSRNSSRSRGSSHSGKAGAVAEIVVINDEKGIFGLSDLMRAAAEVLRNGAFGSSYKAVMANGVAVVVKRLREMNALSKDGFVTQMKRLGNLRHWNVLTPLAYHYRKEEKLLVYEYIPRGSLLFLLHGDRGPSHAELDWPTRLNIVQGIAKGMDYLYTELGSLNLPHGNLKSSNILLSSDNEPLLSDYGFNPIFNPATVAQALFAYKAPEVAQFGQVSRKCDVYCLGIVILEILTGKYPSQYLNNNKGGIDVVEWVASAIAEGREYELFDPEITSTRNSLCEMERLLNIGALCTETDPAHRLDMTEAIRMILEVQVEGGQGGRTMYVLPSLRDGYADSMQQSQVSASLLDGGAGGFSGRRSESDNFSSRSGRHADDNFAFAIS